MEMQQLVVVDPPAAEVEELQQAVGSRQGLHIWRIAESTSRWSSWPTGSVAVSRRGARNEKGAALHAADWILGGCWEDNRGRAL